MTAPQFIVRFFSFAAVFTALVVAINVVADPYLLFNTPRIEGFNARKPSGATHERLMKQYDAIRRPARTLIFGSSRTGVGFNPQSESWRPEDQPVYNLSLAGSRPETMVHYLRHYIASRPPEQLPHTLVVGLDFESFLYNPALTANMDSDSADNSETSLLVLADGQENPGRTMGMLKDFAGATVSLDALLASVSTVFSSYNNTGASLDEQGWMGESIFIEPFKANGVAALFIHKNRATLKQFGSAHLALRSFPNGTLQDLAALEQLIEIADSINAELILFAQPAHADRWELMDRLGYWEDLERWKRAIVDLVHESQVAGSTVEFWDFAGYESIIQEVPPELGDRTTTLTWFWEPAHYRSALGDILIAQMRNQKAPVEFGIRLTQDNLNEHLSQIRVDRNRYRRSQPEQTKRINELVCSATRCDE